MKDALEMKTDHASALSILWYMPPEAGQRMNYSPRLMTSGILNSQRW